MGIVVVVVVGGFVVLVAALGSSSALLPQAPSANDPSTITPTVGKPTTYDLILTKSGIRGERTVPPHAIPNHYATTIM